MNDLVIWPVPPGDLQQLRNHIFRKSIFDNSGWIACDNRIGGHISGDDAIRADDGTVADRDAGKNCRAAPHPNVVANLDVTLGHRMSELVSAAEKIAQRKCGDVFCVVLTAQKDCSSGGEGTETADFQFATDRSFGNRDRAI